MGEAPQHVRLVFALGREEICEETGDDDEGEADDQACAARGNGQYLGDIGGLNFPQERIGEGYGPG